MAETKICRSDPLLLRLPKNQEKVKDVTKLGPERFPVRRRQKARSVVDDTFAAIPIRKHAQIKQIIEQTKYGE